MVLSMITKTVFYGTSIIFCLVPSEGMVGIFLLNVFFSILQFVGTRQNTTTFEDGYGRCVECF